MTARPPNRGCLEYLEHWKMDSMRGLNPDVPITRSFGKYGERSACHGVEYSNDFTDRIVFRGIVTFSSFVFVTTLVVYTLLSIT